MTWSIDTDDFLGDVSVKCDATVLVVIHLKMVQALTRDMTFCSGIRLEIIISWKFCERESAMSWILKNLQNISGILSLKAYM